MLATLHSSATLPVPFVVFETLFAIQLALSRVPPECATEIWITIENVMRVAVALEAAGQPKTITLAAFSSEESAVGKDAWGQSDHQVYR